MKGRSLTTDKLNDFQKYLVAQEKSEATREKYLRDVRVFCALWVIKQ